MKNQSEPVIVGGESPVSFAKLWSQTDAFAGGLQDRNITAGDAVAIRLSNPRAFLITFYGTLRNGCIPVTIPREYGTRDVIDVLNETTGKVYVTDETPFLPILHGADDAHLAITVDCEGRIGVDLPTFLDNDGINSTGSRTGIDIVRQSDSDRGLIAYVGYEGGNPLGVAYTHATLTSAADSGQSVIEFEETIHHLGSLSLSNPIELLYGVTAAILDGGAYHPQASWNPETVRSLLYTDSTIRTFVTPQQYDVLLEHDTNADDAIAVIEPSTTPLEAGTDGDAIRLRGRPETGVTHARTPANIDANRLGEALPRVETHVLEERSGTELVVSGPVTMDSYIGRPDLTEEQIVTIDETQWVRTGSTGLEERQLGCA